jgi:hypothetical protein
MLIVVAGLLVISCYLNYRWLNQNLLRMLNSAKRFLLRHCGRCLGHEMELPSSYERAVEQGEGENWIAGHPAYAEALGLINHPPSPSSRNTGSHELGELQARERESTVVADASSVATAAVSDADNVVFPIGGGGDVGNMEEEERDLEVVSVCVMS